MKRKKIITLTVAGLLVFGAATTAFAFSTEHGANNKPCEVLSDLTGNSVEEIRNEHLNENKTFTQIAEENNVLESYEASVPDGSEYGNGNCDGTGRGLGLGCGDKTGEGLGCGNGRNRQNNGDCGQGNGQGQRLRDGSCVNNQ